MAHNVKQLTAKNHAAKTKNQFWSNVVKSRGLLLLLLPGTIILLINNYLPMAGVVIAFQKSDYRKGLFGGDFVGLKNFEFFFKTDFAALITRNTLLYNLAFILVGTLVALFFAAVLSELRNKFAKKIYQTIILLPYFMSWVVVSYIVFSLFGSDYGFINTQLFPLLGIEPVSWYTQQKYWPFLLIFFNTWHGVGYSSIVYLAAITNMDAALYEAAFIDGASKWQQFSRITLPLLKPIIIIMTLLAIGRIFNTDIGLFYSVPMDSGALYPVTSTIDTYVYRTMASGIGDTNMAAAAGFYQSLVGFVFVVTVNLIVRKIDKASALF